MSGAALAASPVGMAAGVALPLSVAAALMGSVPLVVVAAHCIRVIGQSACQQVGHRLVRRPRYAGIELDLRLGQGGSGTAANTAANKYICFYSGEYAGQCTVTGAVGIYKLCFNNLAVFNIVQFELLGVTEMLKDVSVFVSYCDSHNICSFFCFVFFLNLPFDAVFFIAKVCTAATKLKLAALNFQCEAKHKCVCYLFPCGFIDFLCGCSAYAELCPAFFLA